MKIWMYGRSVVRRLTRCASKPVLPLVKAAYAEPDRDISCGIVLKGTGAYLFTVVTGQATRLGFYWTSLVLYVRRTSWHDCFLCVMAYWHPGRSSVMHLGQIHLSVSHSGCRVYTQALTSPHSSHSIRRMTTSSVSASVSYIGRSLTTPYSFDKLNKARRLKLWQ